VDTGTENRTLRAVVALAIACLVGGPSAAEELARVRGHGYGAATQPAVTNDPPPDFTSDATEHDVDEGLHFTGTGCYDLRQGPRDDDKQAWADTDFIHWTINGATLVAEGRLHDSDPREASICSSEAWGAEFVAACVETTEGDHGAIVAENRIGFSYSYLISGSCIGEASVQLQANAFDIHGAQHTFNLSDQRSEKVGEESEEKVGFTAEVSAGMSATLSNSPRGPSSSVKGGMTTTAGNYREVRAAVSRRFASASGDTGSTPPLVIRESICGTTPVKRDYQVFSDASVVLRARAGKALDGQNSTVLIDLQKFKVENSLKVWKSSSWKMPEPPDAEPPPTTTPRDPDVPAPPGNGGGDPEPGDEADGDPDGTVKIPEFDGLRGHGTLKPPHGLDGERGTLPGRILIGISDAAPLDLVFGVQTLPADVLTFAGRNRLVVREGRRWGSIPFHASRSGKARIQLSLLDEAGLPTAPLFEFDLTAASIHDEPEILLWATVEGKAWTPGRGVSVRGLAGTNVGPLYCGRLGFAGLDTSETLVTIEVDDPSEILSDLPGSVTIPPGETRVATPLRLLPEKEGRATLHLRSGDQCVEVSVVSRAQTWESAPLVRVPVGATAPLPVLLERAERAAREVSAVLSSPSSGELLELEPQTTLHAGETGWYLRVRGLQPGTATAELSSPGLETLIVPLEVTAPTVSIEGGSLHISSLPPAPEGTLRLWTPPGITIAALETQEAAAGFVRVEGVGSRQVEITFEPSPDLEGTLRFAIRFDGEAASGSFEVGVLDTVHEVPETGVLNCYHIEVR